MMTESERQTYIRYRLEKAETTLAEAKLLAQNGYWNTCGNRLYYACFYAITALLIQHEHTTQTHRGVRTLFTQIFVKSRIISLEMNELYNELFDKRQKGDYNDFFDWKAEDILPLIEPTQNFVIHIKQLIRA